MIAGTGNDNNSRRSKIQKICMDEYEKEIHLKKEQLKQITKALHLSKELLGILRKKCVAEFYQHAVKPSFGHGHPMTVQMHPSMRNNTNDVKCYNIKPVQRNTDSAAEIVETKPESVIIKTETGENRSYTTELSKKTKFHIVAGNTSKFIGNIKKEGQMTAQPILSYKWIVYVQMRENKFILESCVKKIRFILDPSYRPNDVIDVYNPPYQVSRCGWGEFSVRIKIFFNDDIQQKPLEIMHQIVLDKTLSGIHTMGAETVVEFWLPIIKCSSSRQFNEVPNTTKTTEVSNHDDNKNQCYKKEMYSACEYEMDWELKDNENKVPSPTVRAVNKEISNIQVVERKTFSITKQKSNDKHELVAAHNYRQTKARSSQISLLKSNYTKHNQSQYMIEGKQNCIIPDHDYVSSYIPELKNKSSSSSTKYRKNQKIQSKYCVENFTLAHFSNIKEAVEYLLQCDLNTDTKYISIISDAQNEWLRAKRIQHLLCKHQDFLDNSESNRIWTTREIIQFARFYGYSNSSKHRHIKKSKTLEYVDEKKAIAQNQALCKNGISTNLNITDWLSTMKQIRTKHYQSCNIVHIEKDDSKSTSLGTKILNLDFPLDYFRNTKCLQNEISFIIDLSKNLSKSFQLKEKVDCAISPLAIFILANVLRTFIKKLLRQGMPECDSQLRPYDICKVIFDHKEFDFLTNCYMGTLNITAGTEDRIKSEVL